MNAFSGIRAVFLWTAAVLMAGAALAQSSVRNPTNAQLLEQLKRVEADPKLSASAYKAGEYVAGFCANCHGLNGNSTHDDTPNLASQNPVYLLNQMQKFASGERRNEFMESLIKAMDLNERVGSAWFFNKQPVTTVSKAPAALIQKGKVYYEKVCFRCHGADGYGSVTYARLAGQQVAYVTMTLKRYRSGS
ncbi:MAG: cytochrome C, partial [Burkholderiaceae bacterium]|nr:cytochrome C [Burkholderiaceae bacterium]